MMTGWWALLWPGAGTMLLAAVTALMVVRFIVPALPEPIPDPDDPFVKPLYRDLVRPGTVIPAVVMAALAGLVSPLAGPMTAAFVAVAGVGGALVAVDLSTTYLPLPLHRLCVVSALGAGALGLALGDRTSWHLVVWGAVFGAVGAFAVFWLVWRVGNSFGYGDVRLAALVGALSGACGVQAWWTALLAGTALGAIAALVMAWWRRRHPHPLGTAFPYGPSLWAGPFVALLFLP